MQHFRQHPRQSSLPKVKPRITDFMSFDHPMMARVTKNNDYFTKGKIEVMFLTRTAPVPVWVLDSGACPKPEVGDYVLVDFIDGEKNNPYMAGLVAHRAYTSNMIRVEKGMIRIQFPMNANDVSQGKEDSASSHMRDDGTYLSSRVYLQLDANGISIHAPSGLPVNILSGSNTTTAAVARVGDSVQVNVGGTNYTGTITSGSGTLKSV